MEGHAFRPWALKRCQPMTHLLVARSEAMSEKLNVVALPASGLEEQPIRHQHGAREVVCKHHTGQFTGLVCGEDRVGDVAIDGVALGEKADLVGDLEVA